MNAGKFATLGLAAAAAIGLASCGSAPAGPASNRVAAAPASVPLATSLASPAGTGWAVVQMGGSRAAHDNFWELFVRPAGATEWKLATPAGVASNGGLVIAAADSTALVGFQPSQQLSFSPLTASVDQGRTWAQVGLVSGGLAKTPDALAAGPRGVLIALTDHGQAELAARMGAAWTSVASRHTLARTAPARACGLTALTAVAFTAAGTPLLGGACGKPGTVAVFARQGGNWHAAAPALPPALRHRVVTVVALATTAGRTTALLAARSGTAVGFLAAWSGNGVGAWTLSPELRANGHGLVAVALWPQGAAGLVLAGGHGAAITGPGKPWRMLPALPARTATLALGAAGQLQALTAAKGSFGVWQLNPRGWSKLQASTVTIPYGSSG